MTTSAHDVARRLREMLPGAGGVKIQKLLYYCQGWHLSFAGEPMFRERIAAWDKGPVVAAVWHDEDKGRPIPAPQALGHSALATIGYVVERYGTLTGNDLIRLTHAEDPWVQADDADGDTIAHDQLRDFFDGDEDVQRLGALGDYLLADPAVRLAVESDDGRPVERDSPDEITRRLLELQQ